ncbi:tyrosine-type recombinase/integrase [Kitasatospora sp. NPDC090091]|uniref:tyrosine-type recombinase/integrase n=1 Tax=Kitasatospora sp. NPDC090091 TaxID=3364081 RepID=UPI003829B54F
MVDTPSLNVRSGGGALALPADDIAATIRRKLDADLGTVRVRRPDGTLVRMSRLELLAEDVTQETFALTLDWLTSTRRGSVNTKRSYLDDLRTVWAPYARTLGHDRLFVGCFTSDHIRAWRVHREAEETSTRSIARYLNTWSSLHKYAAERTDDLPRNPVTQDDRPRVDKGNTSTSTPVLEIEEIQRLCAAADREFDRLVLQLLYTLAGRVSEMCAADVTDLIRRGGRTLVDVTRKENKERILPIPAPVAAMLAAHVGGRTTGPLLVGNDGERLTRHDVDNLLTRLGRWARILTCPDAYTGRGRRPVGQEDRPRHSFRTCKVCRDVTPHVLRASRITHMLDAKVPLAEVQAFADHDNPATTVGYWNRRNTASRNAQLVDEGASIFAPGPPATEESGRSKLIGADEIRMF